MLDKCHKTAPTRFLQNYRNSKTVLVVFLFFFSMVAYGPVSSVASAIKNVLYDISTNSADSNNGKSLIRVNLVIKAVMQPMAAPIINDNVNIRPKSPTALKNAFVSNPPVLE